MAELVIFDKTGINKGRYQIPYGSILHVENGAAVTAGQVMFEWDPYNSPIISNVSGKVVLTDMVENRTYRSETDEVTGVETWTVISDKQHGKKDLHPAVTIVDSSNTKIGNYMLPDGAILTVKAGDMVTVGQTVAKLPRAAGKTRDITGGLPRVAELFEARVPKNKAFIAPIDGLVEKIEEVRNRRSTKVTVSTLVRRSVKAAWIPTISSTSLVLKRFSVTW